MKVLILGGTRFVGRALVETALAQGDEVTLFNRGVSSPGLFADVEQVQGDRDGGLAGLHGRSWDVVIDTCGYVPRLVGDSARLLADAVGLYVFISSISVYADPVSPHSDEHAPLATMADPETEAVTNETYGPLKVLCEREVTRVMDGRALLVRPGLIVGPHDPTDRFTYWPVRIAAGGEVLAPGTPSAPVQFIDVRDLGMWIFKAIGEGVIGPYNATGPAEDLQMKELLETCREVSGAASSFTWVEDQFLLDHEVRPFADLPFWLPAAESGMMQVNIAKALERGLRIRPLAETIRDTLAWAARRPADHQWQAGLPPEQEAALLAAWHKAVD
jgi:2'-hydroxyisoflavone reductase